MTRDDKGQTIKELMAEAQMEREWLQRLDPERAALARKPLAAGLKGEFHIFEGSEFEFNWLNGQTVLSQSGRHKTYAEAFDAALKRLPYAYKD